MAENVKLNANQTMTVEAYIQSLSKAKDVYYGMMDDASPTVRAKLENAVAKYEKVEKAVRNAYNLVVKRFPGLITATRSTMTLAQLNKLSGKKFGETNNFDSAASLNVKFGNYNALDFINDTKGAALGIGAAFMGFNAVEAITTSITSQGFAANTAFAGKGILGVLNQAINMLPLPAQIALRTCLVGGSAALIYAKAIPYFTNLAHKIRNNKRLVNAAKNKADEEVYNNVKEFTLAINADLLKDKENIDTIAKNLYDHPTLLAQAESLVAQQSLTDQEFGEHITEYNLLTPTQIDNLKAAIAKAKEMEKDKPVADKIKDQKAKEDKKAEISKEIEKLRLLAEKMKAEMKANLTEVSKVFEDLNNGYKNLIDQITKSETDGLITASEATEYLKEIEGIYTKLKEELKEKPVVENEGDKDKDKDKDEDDKDKDEDDKDKDDKDKDEDDKDKDEDDKDKDEDEDDKDKDKDRAIKQKTLSSKEVELDKKMNEMKMLSNTMIKQIRGFKGSLGEISAIEANHDEIVKIADSIPTLVDEIIHLMDDPELNLEHTFNKEKLLTYKNEASSIKSTSDNLFKKFKESNAFLLGPGNQNGDDRAPEPDDHTMTDQEIFNNEEKYLTDYMEVLKGLCDQLKDKLQQLETANGDDRERLINEIIETFEGPNQIDVTYTNIYSLTSDIEKMLIENPDLKRNLNPSDFEKIKDESSKLHREAKQSVENVRSSVTLDDDKDKDRDRDRDKDKDITADENGEDITVERVNGDGSTTKVPFTRGQLNNLDELLDRNIENAKILEEILKQKINMNSEKQEIQDEQTELLLGAGKGKGDALLDSLTPEENKNVEEALGLLRNCEFRGYTSKQNSTPFLRFNYHELSNLIEASIAAQNGDPTRLNNLMGALSNGPAAKQLKEFYSNIVEISQSNPDIAEKLLAVIEALKESRKSETEKQPKSVSEQMENIGEEKLNEILGRGK